MITEGYLAPTSTSSSALSMNPAAGFFPPPGVYPPLHDQLNMPLELIGTSILSQQDVTPFNNYTSIFKKE